MESAEQQKNEIRHKRQGTIKEEAAETAYRTWRDVTILSKKGIY